MSISKAAEDKLKAVKAVSVMKNHQWFLQKVRGSLESSTVLIDEYIGNGPEVFNNKRQVKSYSADLLRSNA